MKSANVYKFYAGGRNHRPYRSYCGRNGLLLCLICIGMLFLSGCTVTYSPKAKVHFDPVYQQALSSRGKPAETTETSPAELEKQGYLRIGTIEVKHETKRCFYDECKQYSLGSTVKRLRKEAAQKGGDLVYLTGIGEPSTETAVATEGCKYYETYLAQDPYEGFVYKERCKEYKFIYGKSYLESTRGSVWRKDPNLASIAKKRTLASEKPGLSYLSAFKADDSGVVYDSRTGLEWFVGPDRNVSLPEAKSWVESLTVAGGGWRMPTREELKTLFSRGAGPRNMTPLLETTGWWVISGDPISSSGMVAGFSFYRGRPEYCCPLDYSYGHLRGFAVRIRKQ